MADDLPVEPYDSPLRFLVPSSTESGVSYLVDLGANRGVGECQCKDFSCRCGPSIAKGKPKRCRHILIARDLFTDWAIKKIAEQDKNHETAP